MTDIAAGSITEPLSRRFTSQGLDLHYLDWGNEGAPLVVLVHGNMDNARSWDRVAMALREDWHVVALDLRGHGDSAWSPDGCYLAPYHILDLAELVDLLGHERVHLVGHSFGGNVCWRFSALFPERVDRLVLVDGLGPASNSPMMLAAFDPVPRLRQWVGQRRQAGGAEKIMPDVADAARRLAKRNPNLSPDMAHHLALHGTNARDGGVVWKYDPRVGMFAPEDFAIPGEKFWQEIASPTLLFHGRQSWTSNPVEDGRAACFRDGRTVTYDDAGHWLHHDRFADFMTEVQGFLG